MKDNECSICINNKVNSNTACKICKNKVCIDCFLNIIYNENYCCPFCKTDNKINIEDLDKEVIINYFRKKEKDFKNELSELKTLYFNLNIEYINLQSKI